MSAFAGPSRVTSGLVFDMDMSNTNKSWQGAPTTNLYFAVNPYLDGNGNDWTNSGAGTWNYNDTTITPPYVANGGFIGAVLRISSCVVTTVGNLQVGMGITTVSPSTVYTMSIWVYQTSSTVFQSAPYMRTNVNNNAIAYFAYNGSTDSTTWPTNQWIRISATGTTQSNENGIYLSSYIGNTVGDKVYFYGFQVEQTSTMSALAAGTRSTTQALVDLTGKNTLTASSLTYESGGEFNFNGSGNYIDVTGSGFTSGMTAYTISHWSRRDVESRMPVAGRTSTAFYQYGDNSWAYTHGGTWGEYYYPRVASIPLGTWGFYCIVYNGSNVAIYRNGYLEGTQATTGTADWSQGLRIGYWSAGGGYAYSGKIGSVKFYNRALTAAEVTQEFNALRGRYGL